MKTKVIEKLTCPNCKKTSEYRVINYCPFCGLKVPSSVKKEKKVVSEPQSGQNL